MPRRRRITAADNGQLWQSKDVSPAMDIQNDGWVGNLCQQRWIVRVGQGKQVVIFLFQPFQIAVNHPHIGLTDKAGCIRGQAAGQQPILPGILCRRWRDKPFQQTTTGCGPNPGCMLQG